MDRTVKEKKERKLMDRRVQADGQSACMQCVAGVSNQLKDCDPFVEARYLGFEQCCTIWDTALDLCEEYCTAADRAEKVGACDVKITGNKDVDACDTCITTFSSPEDAGNCDLWPTLYDQCGGPCTFDHWDCPAAEENTKVSEGLKTVQEPIVASPDSCRRCVLAKSSDVSKCLPDATDSFGPDYLGDEICCANWEGWLQGCEKECVSPTLDGDTIVARSNGNGNTCNVVNIVDANFVVVSASAAHAIEACEKCIFSIPEGPACLWGGGQECCDEWYSSWAGTCRFQCTSEAKVNTENRLCASKDTGAEDTLDDSVANRVAVLAMLAFLAK